MRLVPGPMGAGLGELLARWAEKRSDLNCDGTWQPISEWCFSGTGVVDFGFVQVFKHRTLTSPATSCHKRFSTMRDRGPELEAIWTPPCFGKTIGL